eukprot:3089192-Rhodomonas_salina.2
MRYAATRCLVLRCAMLLPGGGRGSSTEAAERGGGGRESEGGDGGSSGSESVYPLLAFATWHAAFAVVCVVLRWAMLCYAARGTEIGYAATRGP